MRLNHLDLPTADVAETRRFFETHFGFRHLETKGDNVLSILSDAGGLVLVLSALHREDSPRYPNGFHIGFLLPTEERVRETYERLTAAGVEIYAPLRHLRGALLFYCYGPGKLLIEIGHRPGVGEEPSSAN